MTRRRLLTAAGLVALTSTAATTTGFDGNALDAPETFQFTTDPPLTGFGTGDGCLAGAGSAASLCAVLALAAAVRRGRRRRA